MSTGETKKSEKVKKEPRNSSVLIDNLEVCRLLGVKPDTWRKRVTRGDSPLPFTVSGARTYYRLSDLRCYLRDGKWPPWMSFRGRSAEGGSEVEVRPAPDPE